MQNKDSNFNQALWLGIGQLCTFLIAFLTAPILVRYFDKTEYGTYKQILYVYTTVMSLFTLGLPGVFSFFIPRLNASQQKFLVNGITRIFLGLGFCFSVFLYLTSDLIANLLSNPELAIGLKIFSPFPLFTLPALGVESIYTALRKTKVIAIYNVLSKILMFVCIIFPVTLLHTDYRGAIIGWGVASFLTFLMAMYLKSKPYVGIKPEKMSNMYCSVFKYCLPLTGAFIAGFFCHSADQFFISRYYGTETFAEYSNGIIPIPIIAMVASSVKNVLVPVISKASSEERLYDIIGPYRSAIKRSAIIIIPILVFCFCFSNDIMIAFFGPEYSISASYFKISIIRDFITILPYFSLLAALALNKFYMNMHIIGVVFIWLLDIVVCELHLSPQWILFVNVSFSIFSSIAAFVFIRCKTRFNMVDRNVMTNLFGITLHCFTVACLLLTLRNLFMSEVNVFVVLIMSGIVFYLILIPSGYLFKYEYMESLFTLIRKKQ